LITGSVLPELSDSTRHNINAPTAEQQPVISDVPSSTIPPMTFSMLHEKLQHDPSFLQCNQMVTHTMPAPTCTYSLPKPSKTKGVAHIKVGLQTCDAASPSFHYALLDSGCSDNLVSVAALQTLPQYDKLTISPLKQTVIQTASKDGQQQVYGRITLTMTFISQQNAHLKIPLPFFVVSGLRHDIFLGQGLLSTPHVAFDTPTKLQLNLKPNLTVINRNSPNLFTITKIFKFSKLAITKRTTTLPPNSTTKVALAINCTNIHPDLFASFDSTISPDFPHFHAPNQTITHTATPSISIINNSDLYKTIANNTELGYITTEFKTHTIMEPISNYSLSTPLSPLTDSASSLNTAATEFSSTDFGFESNATISTSMYEHSLSPEEKRERNQQFRNEGLFQKSVTEVISQSKNITSLEYNGTSNFVPKTDDELLASCNLSHLSPANRELTKQMLQRNMRAFQRHKLDIGECKEVIADIPLTDPNPPNLVCKYVPIPLKYKEQAQQLIDQYCQAGVLAPCSSKCTFTSNIFLVPKPNGKWRLIFDGRLASSFTRQLPLSMGSFDEIFSSLSGMQYMSKYDASEAFFHLKLSPRTSKMLSFFGPDGKRYIYKRAAQGLKFSSYYLSEAMDKILFPMRHNTKSYADDLFTYSNGTFAEHLGLVEKVLERFILFDVRLNIAKLEIAATKLDFLGLTWQKDRLSIPQSKLNGYLQLKTPKSIKEARFLINSLAFYRRFIPRFSQIISPLQELVNHSQQKFVWLSSHQHAVDALKSALLTQTALYIPNKNKKNYRANRL